MENREFRDYNDIELMSLVNCLWRNLYKLIIAAVLVAALVFAIMPHGTYTQYTASRMIVLNVPLRNMDSGTLTSCITAMTSDYVLNAAAEKAEVSLDELRDAVKVEEKDSYIIQIDTKSKDRDKAEVFADALVQTAEEVLPSLFTELNVVAGDDVQLGEKVVNRSKTAVKYAVLAAAVSFVLLAALILLKEIFDFRIKDEKMAESFFRIPVIGFIPELAKDKKAKAAAPNLLHDEHITAEYAEAFNNLGTNFLAFAKKKEIKTLAVLSSVDNEDDCNVAMNLAISLAEAKKKTVIVDFDLKYSRLGEYIAHDSAKGVTDRLDGSASVKECISDTRYADLKAVSAGGKCEIPKNLIWGGKADELISQLREDFDFVIISAPPVVKQSDSLLLAEAADAVLLVARTRFAKANTVEFALQKLNTVGSNVVGMVLSRVDIRKLYSSKGYAQAYKK